MNNTNKTKKRKKKKEKIKKMIISRNIEIIQKSIRYSIDE